MEQIMRKSILVAILTLAALLALRATAQTGSTVVGTAPGTASIVQTLNITATITHINASTREVTLKGPQGRELTVVAGPEVKNFAQLKVGDKVEAQYAESLVLELKKGGGKAVALTERSMAASAKPGEKPGAAAGRQVTVVGDVIDVDAATNKVTVRGPHQTVDLYVHDPEQFKLIAKGDQIEATYTEAVAVSVAKTK
jgi:Cu/Ag efflux protein CusF